MAEAPLQPVKGATLGVLTIALALATFMNVLDTTITNVAVPTISGDLGVSPDQGTWVITAFVVATAIAVPLTGWLAQRFGEVRLFVVCTGLFTLFSTLCGLADSFPVLLFLRVLQGAVAGPMIPLSQSLLMNNYPPDKRGLALAIWGMTTVVAPVLGPIFGGWLTDNYSWPWIFYINIPIGIFSIMVTWSLLKNRETPRRRLPIDAIGLALLVVGVGALQIMLDKGNQDDWFGSTFILTLGITALIAIVLFIIWEWYDPHPVVDLTLFKSRNFNVAAVAITLGFGVYFGGIVIFPLWLQTQLNYTATWAGIASAPVGLLAIVLSPIVGRNLHRVDLRIFVTIAFLVFALCSFWLGSLTTQVDLWQLVDPRIYLGIGIATFFIPLTAMSLAGLPQSRVASASGLLNFLRTLGASFGTSLSITLWDRRATLHDQRLMDHLTNANPALHQALGQLQSHGLSPEASYGVMERLVEQQAFMLSTNDFFWLSGWIFVMLMGLVWFARPPFAPARGAPPVAAE
ncbi:multidrug resistance protein B [Acidihalobacter yilgarnensis]|uniref:Multidrug resistance protein B n=1 Tax=Acidihalobacter yilgarnensis TaxID=2819280 RepID=A0A1D8IJM3_9GAMM|nr:DHA2 family efflux MFS transporter permease subunit [Acidihalobacter yilgarnensis]AOU96690.1 multidrug resistance protein B [Acidihalobacter yilgarnensis]